MQHLGHCVLLLVIVLLSNTSKGNAPESLHHPNNNEQYDNTTHFSNSLRNKSVQTLREASRENSNGNNSWEETSTTNTGREELDEKEDDEFAQRKITENRDGQARAYKMEIFVTPIRYENGVFFTAEPRDNTTKSKKDYIQLCCPLDHRLSIEEWKCLVDRTVTFPFAHREKMHKGAYRLRNVLPFKSLPPCSGTHRHIIIDPSFPGNVYTFLDDATAHFPGGHCLSSSRYCLAAVSNQTGFELIFCGTRRDISWTYVLVAIIVSLIFLLLTFMVYSILREFRNMHGYTLRAYIASVFVSNAMYVVYLQLNKITYSSCVLLGFIFNFAMYSTFLWLNVTCFDLWWTFRRVLPIHTTESREERKSKMSKTFVIYALYAWGVSFVVTILTIIMDIFAPNIPEYLIKPQICKPGFWFGTEKAKIMYFYVPIGVTLICNICLFIWTALKILCDKKRINRQMKDSESHRHDDCNKKRLWVYLKLFMIMGINWIPINLTVDLGTHLFENKLKHYVWFIVDIITPLQGVIIFIIFVCKKRVLQSLMKRFGGSSDSSFCRFRIRHAEVSILQNTTTRTNKSKKVQEMQEQVPTCSRTFS